jgi:hypothetical protein
MELPDSDILPSRMMEGLTDTLNMFISAVEQSLPAKFLSMKSLLDATEKLVELKDGTENVPRILHHIKEMLSDIVSEIRNIIGILNPPEGSETFLWAHAVENLCAEFLEELSLLAPYTDMSPVSQACTAGLTQESSEKLHSLLARLEKVLTLQDVIRIGSAVISLIDRIPQESEETSAGENPLWI